MIKFEPFPHVRLLHESFIGQKIEFVKKNGRSGVAQPTLYPYYLMVQWRFPKMEVPPNHHFSIFFVLKPTVTWGIHDLRPPYFC